jgi:hypothetical protein
LIDCLPAAAGKLAAVAPTCVVVQPAAASTLPIVVSIISVVIALISASIAAFGVRNARAVARQKATLDLIEKVESTEHYRARTSNFTAIKRAGRFGDLVAPTTPDDRAARLLLIDYLNHYELIALGIRNNILDATIYRAWMGGAFVGDWNDAADWIQRQRWKRDASGTWLYDDRAYRNFELVARSWSPDARHLDRDSSPEPRDRSPGDDPLPRLSPDGNPAIGPGEAGHGQE